jgi:hypothetical protein
MISPSITTRKALPVFFLETPEDRSDATRLKRRDIVPVAFVGCRTPGGESAEIIDFKEIQIWRGAEDLADLSEVNPFQVMFPEIVNGMIEIKAVD